MSEGAAKAISLILAGHHPLTLHGLSHVFEAEDDCTVLAVCTSVDSALEAIHRHKPDVLMLDLDCNGVFKILRRIQRSRLLARVIVLAAASDGDMVDAVRLGARAVMLKELPPEEFVAGVRKVHREERPIEQIGVVGNLVRKLSKGGTSRHVTRQLTPREAEIARLAAQGISTREIADRLDVKQGTVKIHLHSIYEKLNVGGRLGLVLFARRYDLI